MLKVTEVLNNEVGYLEKRTNAYLDDKTANAGYGNWTKYARDLDALGVYNGPKNGFDWCDMFPDWGFITAYGLENGMKMTYQPMGGLGAGCTFSMGYYRQNGALYDTPMVGDQCFFSNDRFRTSYHTGFVEGVKNGQIFTIEGNTSSAPGVVANGGCVARKHYPISYCKYGRPNYSLVGEDQAAEAEGNTIRSEIDELPDWMKPTVIKLVDRKILKGNGESLDIENLTPQRLMVMLDRAGAFDRKE